MNRFLIFDSKCKRSTNTAHIIGVALNALDGEIPPDPFPGIPNSVDVWYTTSMLEKDGQTRILSMGSTSWVRLLDVRKADPHWMDEILWAFKHNGKFRDGANTDTVLSKEIILDGT